MTLMKKIFSNPPPDGVTHERYETARRELIAAFSDYPEVAALYEYGSTTTPGVSDLDIMVVFRSDLVSSRPADYVITPDRFPALASLPQGTLMRIPQAAFRRIHWFDEHISLRLLYGEETPCEPLDPPMMSARFLASIVDWLPERTALIVRLLRRDAIDTTFCLRVLRSCAVTLESAARLTGDAAYADFGPAVQELRANWRAGREPELIARMEQGCALGFHALADVSHRAFSHEESVEGDVSLFPDVHLRFTRDPRHWTAAQLSAASSDERIVVPVPATLAPHFSYYSRHPGFLAGQMRLQAHLSACEPRDPSYRAFLATKMALATECGNFLLRNGFRDGLFRFGFYFKNYLARAKEIGDPPARA